MALRAGTKKRSSTGQDQYAGSMAAAIENAFMKEWPVVMNSEAPAPNDHMRLLFIAVAQGVIRHLANNPSSFSLSGSGTVITTDGPLY